MEIIMYTSFRSGKTWYDTEGKRIQAHGGKTWNKCVGNLLVATDEIVSAAQDHSETTFDDIEASKTNG